MRKKDGARAGAMSRKPGKVENETGIIRRGNASGIHRIYEEQ
jgi:hypothetical protein